MATLVEYLDESDVLKYLSVGPPDLTPIGYITPNPEQVLRDLLPNFHVVNYLGISIPSRNEHEDHNQGLKLSPVADGIGLVGTIGMLNQSVLFRACRHEPYSDEQRREIVEKMKSRIKPWQRHQEPLHHPEAKKYALIFDALGYPMSVDELINFTTHENYYDPIPNGGILMPGDLP
jgi:hypothetical protein